MKSQYTSLPLKINDIKPVLALCIHPLSQPLAALSVQDVMEDVRATEIATDIFNIIGLFFRSQIQRDAFLQSATRLPQSQNPTSVLLEKFKVFFTLSALGA